MPVHKAQTRRVNTCFCPFSAVFDTTRSDPPAMTRKGEGGTTNRYQSFYPPQTILSLQLFRISSKSILHKATKQNARKIAGNATSSRSGAHNWDGRGRIPKRPLFRFSHRISVMDGCGGGRRRRKGKSKSGSDGGTRDVGSGSESAAEDQPTNERTSVAIQRLLLTKMKSPMIGWLQVESPLCFCCPVAELKE